MSSGGGVRGLTGMIGVSTRSSSRRGGGTEVCCRKKLRGLLASIRSFPNNRTFGVRRFVPLRLRAAVS